MRLPRFLVIGKYEVKQYLRGQADKTTFVMASVFVLLILAVPQNEGSNLPSAKGIYRVGLMKGSPLDNIGYYQLRYFYYPDKLELIYANSLDLIDAFALSEGSRVNIYGSGTKKADASLTRLHELVQQVNTFRAIDYLERDPSKDGVFFPIRVGVIEEEINYTQMMNVTMAGPRGFPDINRRGRRGEILESPELPELSGFNEDSSAGESGLEEVVDFPSASGGVSYVRQDRPGSLDVGMPFEDLYRNMSMLSPLIFLSILFALSIARERVENGIQNLFTAPLNRMEILLGKSSPYLGACLAYSFGVGFFLAREILPALKIGFVYSVLSFVMLTFSLFAMLSSRSYRELTFIGSFALFTFFFFIILPNVFSGVNVLAYISPLDLVTSIQYGAMIGNMDVFLSLLPYMALGLFFLSFTLICFHSEIIVGNHSLKSLFRKFYSGLARETHNPVLYTVYAIVILVPFIFVVESILAYLIMPLGPLAPLLSVPFLAAIEEVVKILPFLYRKMNPLVYAVASGTSFFIAEKVFNAYLISKVYQLLGGPYVMFVVKGALFTWLIHIITVLVFALIARFAQRRISLLLGLITATTIHLIYNIYVIYGL